MNGHSNIDTLEATEHLKNILNVGKSEGNSDKIRAISNGNMEAGDDVTSSSHDSNQRIDLCFNKDTTQIPIHGTDVDIYSSPLDSDSSCSQVFIENIIAYGWEEKYYQGRLISIHLSGLFLACVLKASQKAGCFVRILCPQTETRYLIKDYKHEVKDIAFAHTLSQVLLGSVDACGELLVHQIGENGTTLTCNLLIRILRPSDWLPSEHNHVIWCLYIPDENAEDEAPTEDASSLLVVTHNEKAEIWNIDSVIKEHGPGNLSIDDVKIGAQIISDQMTAISTATFSPDGTALAIGNMEGVVNFFQVNIGKDVSPKCLHQWIPHPNKSLSSLFFLDNYKNHRPDAQLWKFALTGADNNTELKIWTCETWTCLQTIRIHPNPNDNVMPCLKAEMDLSSQCLLLSDVNRKVLLILNLQQEPMQSNIIANSLSECRLPFSVLSLVISNISCVKMHSLAGCKNSEDEGDRDQIFEALNEEENYHQYKIKLFWIQNKSLQMCNILYKPIVMSPLQSVESVSSLSQESYVFKDGLSDMSLESHEGLSHSSKDLFEATALSKSLHEESNLTPHISLYSDILLTPDDFTSPSHPQGTSFSHEANSVEPHHRRKSSQHSANSSPSREVAEILAPTKVLRHDEIGSEMIAIKDDEETLSNNASRSPSSSINQQEFIKEWPQAPDPIQDFKLSPRCKRELIQNHEQLFSGDVGELTAIKEKLSQMTELSEDRSEKLDQLIKAVRNMVDVQQHSVKKFEKEIAFLKQDQKQSESLAVEHAVSKFENIISQKFASHFKSLESLVVQKGEEVYHRSSKEFNFLKEQISSTFSKHLDNTLKQELTDNIIPQMNRVLDAIAKKMQIDFNQKFAATDASLRENITKHLSKKDFVDSLAQSLSPSLQGIVQSACKDIFQNSVVPSFDKCCNHLFQQLNEQFHVGTLEYMQHMDKHGQKVCSSFDSQVEKIRGDINTLVNSSQQLVQAQSSQSEHYNLDLIKHRDVLLTEMRHAIQEETTKALREQTQVVMSSRASTPVQFADPQIQKQQLLMLIKQGNLDSAFQQALSAMDVQLVLFVCENVNPDQVFGPSPCPLKQHVLLSLVNQLSSDLTIKTDIKIRYIEDVIASLDVDSPIVKEHSRNVLESLHQKITLFQQKNPSHALTRNLRRIGMVIHSLVKA